MLKISEKQLNQCTLITANLKTQPFSHKTMYLNHAFIVGNLTRDPELRALPGGTQVASFSVATNRVWKDKNGAKQESSDYHNVVVFGKQAEACAQYLKKGSQVLVEGRMQTRSWEKDGAKQYRTEIVADRVQFGMIPKGEQKIPTVSHETSAPVIEYPEEDTTLEDIPF